MSTACGSGRAVLSVLAGKTFAASLVLVRLDHRAPTATQDLAHEEVRPVVMDRVPTLSVSHLAHLHASEAKLDIRLADVHVLQVDHPVREEVLPVPRQHLRSDGHFGDEEDRDAE